MTLDDQIYPYVKRRDWAGLEAFLARHPPGDDPNERAGHAYWSVIAPIDLGKFGEALRRLDALDAEFQCRCWVCKIRAEIYRQMGDKASAIEALRAAPWGEEMERFPALAMESMFTYCYFLAQEGREAPPKLVEAIPSDYVSIQYNGKQINKADLLALIERDRKRPQQPVGSL